MKQTVGFSQFVDGFSNRKYNFTYGFTYGGLRALFYYLEQLEKDIGEEIDFDPIAICCDYTEYADFDEIKTKHDVETIEELRDLTTVIKFDEGIIIRRY